MKLSMMEKITLKPTVKELLYKTDEVNTHFDVLSYSGNTSAERALGSIFVIGHASFEEEDLGYVVSLISSLARREYYSDQSLKDREPKKAFEQTLKKLNEVLEDFFKNKTLALSVGLAAIAGDQLYISKLGKFKIGLARNGEYVDVLNNVALFQKSDEDEEQFSNIISGKLQSGDKVFAYYPARSITSREKSLQSVLLKEDQEQFGERIAQLAAANPTFSCCAVHIALEQIKEIPLQTVPVSTYVPSATLASVSSAEVSGRTADSELSSGNTQPSPASPPRVIAAELSVSSKSNVFSKIGTAAANLRSMDRLPARKKFRTFVIVALIVIIPVMLFAFLGTRGDSTQIKTALKNATESLKLAQTKIAENNQKDARALLLNGLEITRPYDSENILKLRNELQASLDTLDKVSSAKAIEVGTVRAELHEDLQSSTRILSMTPETVLVWFNGAERLSIYDEAGKKLTSYTLKDPATASDATLYSGNLYTLAGNHIYKYADAINGGTKRTEWGSDDASGTLISIAIDGNLYALSKDGKVITYFRGEKKGEVTLAIPVVDGMKLYAPSEKIWYIMDAPSKYLYAINPTNGALTATYKIDNVGNIKDITIGQDGDALILSADLKIWKLSTGAQP